GSVHRCPASKRPPPHPRRNDSELSGSVQRLGKVSMPIQHRHQIPIALAHDTARTAPEGRTNSPGPTSSPTSLANASMDGCRRKVSVPSSVSTHRERTRVSEKDAKQRRETAGDSPPEAARSPVEWITDSISSHRPPSEAGVGRPRFHYLCEKNAR